MPQIRSVSMHQTPAPAFPSIKDREQGKFGSVNSGTVVTIPVQYHPYSHWTTGVSGVMLEIQVLPVVSLRRVVEKDDDNNDDAGDRDSAAVSWDPRSDHGQLLVMMYALWSVINVHDFGKKMTHLLRERIDCQTGCPVGSSRRWVQYPVKKEIVTVATW
mmetsp:Transcript_46216/g.49850  ORF Transcript_46216/g.49850 Transcript_46216/m.49850 type:complete len:159 (+) Transcript_46216:980-1456(+)